MTSATSARTADATDNGLRLPPHDGQNEREIAVGRRNWTFVGSDEGGRRSAAVYSLIETCQLNDVDLYPWLAHVLARLPDHPVHQLADLLPSAWKARRAEALVVAAA